MTPVVERFEPAMLLAALFESPLNTRKRFNEAKLAELADSIRRKGVITPLLVRPFGAAGFEIAAGHRRFRAAKVAGRDSVPVIVREMPDDEFLEVLTIENLQREDVHPLEEGQGYAELLSRPGYDVESLAAKLGKSESYVAQRLKLVDLVPDLQEDFLGDRFGFSHALVLARLQAKDQKEVRKSDLYDDDDAVISLNALRAIIKKSVYLDLRDVAWDVYDAALLPAAGSCTACPKRTGFHPSLFPELSAKEDYCQDKGCYGKKQVAIVALRVKEISEQTGRPAIQVSNAYRYDKAKQTPGRLYSGDWKPMQDTLREGVSPRCGNTKVAVVVELDRWGRSDLRFGQRLEVCTDKDCLVHFRHSDFERPKPTVAEKLDMLREAREHETTALIDEKMVPALLAFLPWPWPGSFLNLFAFHVWKGIYEREELLQVVGIELPADLPAELKHREREEYIDEFAEPLFSALDEAAAGRMLIACTLREFSRFESRHLAEKSLPAETIAAVRAAAEEEVAKTFDPREAALLAPEQKATAKKAAGKKKAGKK